MCIKTGGCPRCGDTGEWEALSGDCGPCSCEAGKKARAVSIAASQRRKRQQHYSVPFATFCDLTCELGRAGRCKCAMRRHFAVCPNECDPDTRRACKEGWGEGAE